MNELGLLNGIDLPIPELALTVHPPRIKDIAYITEQQFFSAVQYICLDKETLFSDKSVLGTMSNFQVFMKVMEQSQDKHKKTAVLTVLALMFPPFKPLLTPTSLIFANLENPDQNVIIDDEKFEILQSVLKEVLCVNSLFQGQNVIYNPVNEAAKKIADKIMRGRKKVAEQKQGSDNQSVLSRYESILAIGQKYTLDYCSSLTLYQLFDQIERYTLKQDWDVDLKIRLTGTDPKTEVKNWMDDIHHH